MIIRVSLWTTIRWVGFQAVFIRKARASKLTRKYRNLRKSEELKTVSNDIECN